MHIHCRRLAIAAIALSPLSMQALAQVPDVGVWSDWVKESDHEFVCGQGAALSGRQHGKPEEKKRDENAPTRYMCVPTLSQVTHDADWHKLRDGKKDGGVANHNFRCPDAKVLIGRKHKGDENHGLSYLCGSITRPITNEPPGTDIKESSGVPFTCAPGSVLRGMGHHGDENGTTHYFCGVLGVNTPTPPVVPNPPNVPPIPPIPPRN